MEAGFSSAEGMQGLPGHTDIGRLCDFSHTCTYFVTMNR